MHKAASIKKQKLNLLYAIILFVLIYTAILIIVHNKIPDVSQLLERVETLYGTYGYYLIFFGALIEGTFILGPYIPGSFIVLLGVSLSRLGIISFPLVIILGTFGFCLGYSINYCLGRFGLFRIIEEFGLEKQIFEVKNNLKNHYNKTLFWGYMMANTASILSTASGILKVPFKEFILKTILIQTFWSLLLGGLAYTFGITFINLFIVYFGTIAFVGIGLYIFNKARKRKREKETSKVH